MKKQDGKGRVAVNEILVVNSAVSAIIREGATQKLQDVIVAGKGEGMQFMDDAIMEQLMTGAVNAHEAYMKAIDKQRFKPFLPPEEEGLANAAGVPDDVDHQDLGKRPTLRPKTAVDEIKKNLKHS